MGASRREEALLTLRAEPERLRFDASGLGVLSGTWVGGARIERCMTEASHTGKGGGRGRHDRCQSVQRGRSSDIRK